MVWGPMIAWYLFLAGASAGAFLTSTFVEAKIGRASCRERVSSPV